MITDPERRALIDTVRARTDIVALVSGYLPLTRAGRLFKAPCPFHAERTPSFVVTPDRQTWRCFGACGAGGDVFSFLMRAENIDFAEALRRLDTGAVAPVRIAPRPVRVYEPKPAFWLPDAERLVAGYCQAFDRFSAWGKYKPLSRATIEQWQLGVGVLPEFSAACQHRRLIVPTRIKGEIVALSGREMGCGCEAKYKTKWINAKDGQGRLFNEDGLKEDGVVVVTENRVDALLVMEHWPEVTAVALGSSHASSRWIERIAGSRPRRVVVWLDNDGAGCPNRTQYAAFLEECRAKGVKPNPSGGTVLARELRRLGVNAEAYIWPEDRERHRDAGQEIVRLRQARQSA